MTVVKKFAVCVLCFAFFFVCCFFGEEEGRDAVPVLVGVESIRTIIIDAGHGGLTNTID